MQAVLLVGGLGTRLRSVINDRPKPMALIEGRPFVEYVLRELSKSGIDHVIFAVGYMGRMVEDYFGDGSRFSEEFQVSMRCSYAYEKELLGTAGAIKNAGSFITEDRFFVLNGDTFYRIDYRRMCSLYDTLALDMAMVLRRVDDITRYGEASVSAEGRLTGFNEKTQEQRSGTINGGIYLMSRELLLKIPEGKVSLENEMIPLWLREKRGLGGMINEGYFIDIGVPEDYFKFESDVKNRIVTWQEHK